MSEKEQSLMSSLTELRIVNGLLADLYMNTDSLNQRVIQRILESIYKVRTQLMELSTSRTTPEDGAITSS